MTKPQYREYRRLKNDGWDVSTPGSIKPNPGSETVDHFVTKGIVAYAGLNNNYSVDTEVSGPSGRIDVLYYDSTRLNWAIEVETCAYEDILNEKQRKYVGESHYIDEMQVIELEALPDDIEGIYEAVRRQLGFDR